MKTKSNAPDKILIFIGLGAALLWLSGVCMILYIAFHFISKFW